MKSKKLNRNGSIVTATLLAFALTACSTLDPYTGEQKTSKSTAGAIIGAVSGAVAGILSGDNSRERRKRALIGAGVGAVAGGSIGHYMDNQEAKLRTQLEGSGVSVTRDGDNIILNMPGNITFASDSAQITNSFYTVLDSVTLVLNEYDKTLIEIIGHTDSSGAESYNQLLSEKRATSVADYLLGQHVLPQRIAKAGMGESAPIASNETPQGRQINRRVELTLVPLAEE